MNIIAEVTAAWRRWYPGCPPIRWHMREAFPDRWCRVYHLPDAQRIPKNLEERRSLVERHAAVSAEVLGMGARCAAILVQFDQPRNRSESVWVDKLGATDVENWIKEWSDLPGFASEELGGAKLSIASCVWPPALLRQLVLDVAADRSWMDVVFVALDSGRAYSPYEGGADLFVENLPTAHALWDKYLALGWTPPELYP